MAGIAMLIGGAIVNAFAFTGSNFLFSKLKPDKSKEIDVERKRHDLALEEFTRVRNEWERERTNTTNGEDVNLYRKWTKRSARCEFGPLMSKFTSLHLNSHLHPNSHLGLSRKIQIHIFCPSQLSNSPLVFTLGQIHI